jgi:2-C-methyl-D-erythritol 2,4-cyclodiphosphate synthase
MSSGASRDGFSQEVSSGASCDGFRKKCRAAQAAMVFPRSVERRKPRRFSQEASSGVSRDRAIESRLAPLLQNVAVFRPRAALTETWLAAMTDAVPFRIGQGFDVHAFKANASADGDHVVLGGVRIPHERGILAHSDGDVALHALCDAMLGALALGDIGKHFPPSDPRWKDADSRDFVRHCGALLRERGWRVGNADITVICERPKIGPHADAMRANIAADLAIGIEDVSVKATTSEKLGFTGRGEGIAAQAVCLLVLV